MRNISWGCIIIGMINIILAILNTKSVIFSIKSISDSLRLILPFQGIEASFAAVYQTFPNLLPIIKNTISPFTGYAISLMLFISGIGVLLRKPWGRNLSCIYAKSMLVISAVGVPLTSIYFIKEFIRISRNPSFMDWIIWGGP